MIKFEVEGQKVTLIFVDDEFPQHTLITFCQLNQFCNNGFAVLFQLLNAREAQCCANLSSQIVHVGGFGPDVRNGHSSINQRHHLVGDSDDIVVALLKIHACALAEFVVEWFLFDR